NREIHSLNSNQLVKGETWQRHQHQEQHSQVWLPDYSQTGTALSALTDLWWSEVTDKMTSTSLCRTKHERNISQSTIGKLNSAVRRLKAPGQVRRSAGQ